MHTHTHREGERETIGLVKYLFMAQGPRGYTVPDKPVKKNYKIKK